ncbi:MAG: TolB family protein [Cytophagaceae bacterium]
MKKGFLLLTFLFALHSAKNTGHAQVFALPSPLNTHLNAETQPSISANGRTMLLRADTGEDKAEEVLISYQEGGRWSRPAPLTAINTGGGKLFNGQHSISHDGNTIVFISNRYGGIGNQDVWFMERNSAGTWMSPENPGKPINSPGVEGDPSLSPDGKKLFFVRFDGKPGPNGQPCGKIFVAEKKGRNLWSEPVALPAPINKGCECNPRMLSDGQTMTFASVRDGGKGGYDQYLARLDEKGKWSTPVPFETVNTENDDLYISIPATGELVYFTAPAKVGTDIVAARIPDHLKPAKVIIRYGKITDENKSKLDARIVLTDLKTNELNVIGTWYDGSYTLFLPHGLKADIAFQANDNGYLWHSSHEDITLEKTIEENKDIQLPKIKPGLTLDLIGMDFSLKPVKLQKSSHHDLNRLTRLIKDNPGRKYVINVAYTDIILDTIPTPDLTEIKYDSIETFIERISEEDSSQIILEKEIIVKTYYHNNRTPKEAEEIYKFLIEKGVPPAKIEVKGIGKSTRKVPGEARITELNIL